MLSEVAFVLVQLLERGSLLRRLASELGKTVLGLFGGLKKIAQRLLESLRSVAWPSEWFEAGRGRRQRIGFDTS